MAVMSFAHLKTKKSPEQGQKATPPPSGPSAVVRNTGQSVISFVHLKPKKPIVHEEEKQMPWPRVFKIPAVMSSASLIAVNYCRGCGRFLPAEELEKDFGNSYGRCLRNITVEGVEVWKVIKRHITVSRCSYFIAEESR